MLLLKVLKIKEHILNPLHSITVQENTDDSMRYGIIVR